MSEQKQVDVIIYRVRETGLEVFLVNHEQIEGQEPQWKAPSTEEGSSTYISNYIQLDPVTDANGDARQAIAIEADWHEIPSLRALIYEDYRVAKEKAKQHLLNFIPSMERGAYFAVKEAFKRVMPEQYAFLKELKDIVAEKNSTRYI
jgi:predicted NUDIX family NTP pyrophosphohydrolase